MCRIVRLSVAIAALLAIIPHAQAIPVALTECLVCPLPGSFSDPCNPGQKPLGCFHRRLWCERIDSAPYIVQGGTAGTITGTTLICTNCTGCPNCPPPVNLTCQTTLSATFTESVAVTVNAGIETEAEGVAESLEASIGHINQRTLNFSASAGAEGGVPPCRKLGYQARIAIQTGIVMGMNHTWSAGGIIDNHFGLTCCMENIVFTQPDCHSCMSTATGSAWMKGYIDTILNEACR
jgi:hypothetical protein